MSSCFTWPKSWGFKKSLKTWKWCKTNRSHKGPPSLHPSPLPTSVIDAHRVAQLGLCWGHWKMKRVPCLMYMTVCMIVNLLITIRFFEQKQIWWIQYCLFFSEFQRLLFLSRCFLASQESAYSIFARAADDTKTYEDHEVRRGKSVNMMAGWW